MSGDYKKPTGIALGKEEIELIDNYRANLGLSRSAVVRLMIHKFFLKKGGINNDI